MSMISSPAENKEKPKALLNKARSIVSGDAHYFAVQTELQEIRMLLDKDNVSDKLEGIKIALAETCKGIDMAPLFPDVVKNIVCPNHSVKKLVYAFVMHYCESCPNEALLSVSQFQRDMTDRSPYIRALALRVLSSIRVPIIAPVTLLALRKCAGDVSSYVRQTAAIALPKLTELAPNERPQLEKILETLLGDGRPNVVGAAMIAYHEMCPTNWELLHKHFRKVCKMLPEFDEWAQIMILGVLQHYARTQFVSPMDREKRLETAKVARHFYDDCGDDGSEDNAAKADRTAPKETDIDVDHRLMLRSALPLLSSRNKGVVMAVCSLYAHCASPAEFQSKCIKSLMRIVHSGREVEYVVLANIHTLVCSNPEPFRARLREFFVYSEDPNFVRQLKLGIIARLATEKNSSLIFKELRTYFRSPDMTFVKQALRVVAHVGMTVPEVSVSCLTLLMELIKHKNTDIVAEAVMILRILLQSAPGEHARIIAKLANMLTNDKIATPVAGSSVLWLLGEHCKYSKVMAVAPEVFRTFAKKFATLSSIEKVQCINLGMKLHLKVKDEVASPRIQKILEHVLELGRFDMDFDVRDKCRFLRTLLSFASPAEQEAMITASEGKQDEVGECEKHPDDQIHEDVPQTAAQRNSIAAEIFLVDRPLTCLRESAVDRVRFTIGTMSHIASQPLTGYAPLPDFPLVAPDPSVREVRREMPSSDEGEDDESSLSSYSSDEAEGGRRNNAASRKKSGRGFYSDDNSESDVSWSGSGSEGDFSGYSSSDADDDAEDGEGDDGDDDEEEEGDAAERAAAKRLKKVDLNQFLDESDEGDDKVGEGEEENEEEEDSDGSNDKNEGRHSADYDPIVTEETQATTEDVSTPKPPTATTEEEKATEHHEEGEEAVDGAEGDAPESAEHPCRSE
eukprot:PhM_4_TR8011/c0_g1_i1/m.45138/K12397/AP3B; AP-3 complex subunit beta